MEPTEAEKLLVGWWSSSVGDRPSPELEAAFRTVALRELAGEVAAHMAKVRPPTEAEIAAWYDRVVRWWELARLQDATDVRRRLIEVAVECRSDHSRARRRWRGQVARAIFAAQFAPGVSAAFAKLECWGEYLLFVSRRYLACDVLRSTWGHDDRWDALESHHGGEHQESEDIAQQMIAFASGLPESFVFRSVSETIAYLVTHTRFWFRRQHRDSHQADPEILNEVHAIPAVADGDIPPELNQCQERFAPHDWDARRLHVLRLLRGPMPDGRDPSALAWDTISSLLRQADQNHSFPPEFEATHGTAISPTIALNAFRQFGEGNAILHEVLAANPPSPDGSVWTPEFLASYYFFLLLLPDSRYATYPPERLDGISNPYYFWVIDFLKYNYHLPKAVRVREPTLELKWECVVEWIRSVDALIACHRLIRITRLPTGLGWQRLTTICNGRRPNVDAVKRYHSRTR